MNVRKPLSKSTLPGILMAGLITLAVSCGGGSSKPPMVSDFCQMWAAALCQIADSCLTSKTDCESKALIECQAQATSDQASGVRIFTPANMARCVNETSTVFKKMSGITTTDLDTVADYCNYVFQGTVAKLAACTTKYDCAGTVDAVICDKGVCAASATKAAGAGCSDPGAVCTTGSYCSKGTTQFYTCMPKGKATDACDDSTPCLETLRCSAGKCVARVDIGGACASDDDCSTTAPYCDPYAGYKCAASLSFSSGSTSCTNFFSPSTPDGGAAGAGGAPGAAGADGAAGAIGGATDAGDDAAEVSSEVGAE